MYSLRSSFLAHDSDARTLATLDSCIISGGSDGCMKQWTQLGKNYEETMVMNAQTDGVSSVCCIPPFGSFEFGLILCGGVDGRIVGYIPYNNAIQIELIGHTNGVSSLCPSHLSGHLLSASWDCTAKHWNIGSGTCVTTYNGHSKGLWSVISMPQKRVLTGSSDFLIKLFTEDGQVLETYQGHTDTVRGLACYGPDSFLSCSMDGTLRKWNTGDWDNDILASHDTSLCSVAVNDKLIAYGGENILFICTKDDKQNKEMTIPQVTVWAITILENSDIVAATSDGYMRIFTRNQERLKLRNYRKDNKKLGFGSNSSSVSDSDSSLTSLPGKKQISEDLVLESTYFPPSKHLFIEHRDMTMIFKKIYNYLTQMKFTEEENNHVTRNLSNLVANNRAANLDSALDVLITAIAEWPDSLVYPVLDVARILILMEELHHLLFNEENASRLFSSLDRFLSQKTPLISRMFLFRIYTNMFCAKSGENFLFAKIEDLLPKLAELVSGSHKGLQVAATTFVLNMSLTSVNRQSLRACQLCHTFINTIFTNITEPEAIYRLLVALGTVGILKGADLMNNGLLNFVQTAYRAYNSDGTPNYKIALCASALLQRFFLQDN